MSIQKVSKDLYQEDGITYCNRVGAAQIAQNILKGFAVKEEHCRAGHGTTLFNEAGNYCHSRDSDMYWVADPFAAYGKNKKALSKQELRAFYLKRGAITSNGFLFRLPKPNKTTQA